MNPIYDLLTYYIQTNRYYTLYTKFEEKKIANGLLKVFFTHEQPLLISS